MKHINSEYPIIRLQQIMTDFKFAWNFIAIVENLFDFSKFAEVRVADFSKKLAF